MQIEELPKTNYTGSLKTYENVKQQILERFGPAAAKSYQPLYNCRSYKEWKSAGYTVNPKEKSLRSTVVIEKKDKCGKVTSKHIKTVCLFYQSQVSKTV